MTQSGGARLLHLPVVYAVALALRDAGLTLNEIASRLELPPESMPALVEIAEAKLSSLNTATLEEIDLSCAAHATDTHTSPHSSDLSDHDMRTGP